jgi:hypothetical protein
MIVICICYNWQLTLEFREGNISLGSLEENLADEVGFVLLLKDHWCLHEERGEMLLSSWRPRPWAS